MIQLDDNSITQQIYYLIQILTTSPCGIGITPPEIDIPFLPIAESICIKYDEILHPLFNYLEYYSYYNYKTIFCNSSNIDFAFKNLQEFVKFFTDLIVSKYYYICSLLEIILNNEHKLDVILNNFDLNTLSIYYFIPESIFIIFIIILLIFGLFNKKLIILKTKTYNNSIIINILININIIILFILSILFFINSNHSVILFNNSLIINYSTQILKIIICLFSNLCLLTFKKYNIKNKINNFEYLILFNLAILSSLLLISCNDLILLYICIELQSFCFYILSSNKKNYKSSNACLKYWILGAFISFILLYGFCFIYIETGLTNLNDIKNFILTSNNYKEILFNNNDVFDTISYFSSLNNFFIINLNNFIFIGFIFIYIALLFKLTVAPFHIWAPDVYEGAPSIMSMFFNTMPKIALIVVLVRILNVFNSQYYNIIIYILIINIILSLIIATFSTFKQVILKNFLIYSSLSHIGYILLGLTTGTVEGLQSTIIYYIIYIISIINIWAIYIYLENKILYISDLKLLLKYNKSICICFLISIFSMAGIPPFAGFIAKMSVFFACIEQKLYFLVFSAALISILSIFYYIRLIKYIFFENNNNNIYNNIVFNNNENKSIVFVISFTTILLIYFFIDPVLLEVIAHKIALNLLCY